MKALSITLRNLRTYRFVSLLVLCIALASCVPLDSLLPRPQGSGNEDAADAWVRTLSGKSMQDQANLAAQMWFDKNQPQALRDRAAFLLAVRPHSQTSHAQQALAAAYAKANAQDKSRMEMFLQQDLRSANPATRQELANNVPLGQVHFFPWSVIKNLGSGQSSTSTSLGSMPQGPAPTEISLALLLPLQGNFSLVANQVYKGAQVAQSQLTQSGIKVNLQVVDTENPNWIASVAQLPSQYTVLGGPLRGDRLSELVASGQHVGRAMFAFLGQLPEPSLEGNQVWRFFTSTDDQMRALLDFTSAELGIHSYGSFYPADPYGLRMNNEFEKAARLRRLSVTSANYPLEDLGSWVKVAGNFVGATATEKGSIPKARASFQAVFLPDSWKNMDLLISSLRYHGAHRMVMMGTSLWEQSLASKPSLVPATYDLSIFPGAWNPKSLEPTALALMEGMAAINAQADSWASLGYDFVMMASKLGLSSVPLAPILNQHLVNLKDVAWSGAPFVWDPMGRAQRKLFLFQPVKNGLQLLDRAAFTRYFGGAGPQPNREVVPTTETEALDALDALLQQIVLEGPSSVSGQSAPAQTPAPAGASVQTPASPAATTSTAPAAAPVPPAAASPQSLPQLNPAAMPAPQTPTRAPQGQLPGHGVVTQPPAQPVPIPPIR